MGATPKGGGRDTSAKNRAAQCGPLLLQLLGDGAAPPASPAGGPACPPLLRNAVRDAALEAYKSDRPPALAVPALEAIQGDPRYSSLAEIVSSAMEKARAGLRAGRPAEALQKEIKGLVMDDVQNLIIEVVPEGWWQSLLGDDQHEQEAYLGVVAEAVVKHLAATVVGDAEAAPDEGRAPAELVRAALLSAEPTLFLILKIVAALAGTEAERARRPGAAKSDDSKIVLIDAVAQAVIRIGAPAALNDPPHPGGPGNQEQVDRTADGICREILQQLSDPQQKIDGQDTKGERAA